jgi:hemerythrin-like domain-containing protein
MFLEFIVPTCSNVENAKPVVLPRSELAIYASYYGICFKYLVFRTNSTYSRFRFEHLFVWEPDKGNWHQASNGIVCLESDIRLPDIECGQLSISMAFKEKYALLPSLKQKIETFLKEQSEKEFSPSKIKNIMRRNEISMIWTDSSRTKVPRENLELLIQKIEEYLRKGENQKICLIPMKYKGVDFLHWHNAGSKLARDLEGKLEIINETKDKKDLRETFFVKIDLRRAHQETKNLIPFPISELLMQEEVPKALKQMDSPEIRKKTTGSYLKK